MSSGTKQLMNLLKNQFDGDDDQQGRSHDKRMPREQTNDSLYTYRRLSETQNWENEEPLQVEGNLILSLLGGRRFFAFDNHTIEQLPKRKISNITNQYNLVNNLHLL